MTLECRNRLLKRKTLGNLRKLQNFSHLMDFASNDYLGLARSSLLASTIDKECHDCSDILNRPLNGFGSTGSRLLTGNTPYVENLEAYIASFHGHEAGLLFNCGYMANVGLFSAVVAPEDTIFFDSHIHASAHDGIRLSRAKSFPFKHNDCEHLRKRLHNCQTHSPCFICIESLYSTDGSLAPIRDICQLAKEYGAHLIVDEAHAIGVWGPQGRGLVAEQKLNSSIFAQVVTFGKALGTFGAIVLGKDILKQTLINFARSYIYTTALPHHCLVAIKCSYDLFPQMNAERKFLHHLIHTFRQIYASSSMTQIQPIFIQGNQNVKDLSKKLNNYGFDVRSLMSPTVQKGHELLRLCLHAFNTEDDLSRLISIL